VIEYDTPVPTDTPPSLQFDRADFGAPASSRLFCTICKQQVMQSYYTVGNRIVCASCHELHVDGGSELNRFLRAFAAALVVAIAGATVWWLIRTYLHFELALISIAIGVGVARAIIWGTYGRTNVFYQVFAVVMTYAGIVLNYVPDILGEVTLSQIDSHMVLVILSIAFRAPFLTGASNIIGILIIGFGLWEAWKLTGSGRAVVAGPFSISHAANV
jgi:hypothetical protein